jgi:hypothetical protein
MFAAEFTPADTSKRRTSRTPVSLDARLGQGELARAVCKVVDLSTHGCRLQTYSELKRGSTLWLTLPGLAPLAADVMWAADFVAGCQFHKPLSQAAFQRLT